MRTTYIWDFKHKITWLALKNFELKEVLRKMVQPVLGSIEVVGRINTRRLFGSIKTLSISNFGFESDLIILLLLLFKFIF